MHYGFFSVSNRYLDINDISEISMNVKQEVSHFVVVVVGQSQSLVFVVEGYTRKLPIKLFEFGLVVSKKFSKANQSQPFCCCCCWIKTLYCIFEDVMQGSFLWSFIEYGLGSFKGLKAIVDGGTDWQSIDTDQSK